MGFSIKTKVFAGLFAVIVLIVVSVYLVLQTLLLDFSRQEVGKNLEDAKLYFSQFEEMRSDLLLTHAASISQTPHLKAILSIPDVDSATVYSAADGLENIGPQDLRLVIGTDGHLLADLNNPLSSLVDLREFPGVSAALSGIEFVGNWQYNDEFYKVAIIPSVGNSQLLGLIVIGEILANQEYRRLAEHVGGAESVILLGEKWFPVDSIRNEIVANFASIARRDTNSSVLSPTDGEAQAGLQETLVDSHLYYTASLQLEDVPGTVIFYRSGELVEASIERILWLMVFCSVLALVVGFILSLSVSRRITAPVVQLTKAAQNFGQGKFDVRVAEHGNDEFGVLNEAFNDMAELIQNSRQQLLESVDEAKAANLAKSEFLARMSHEIRTPMNAILGFTQLILTSDSEKSKSRGYVELIQESGQLLLSLINDILDFSKIDAGKMELNANPFDLRLVVEGTIGMFKHAADGKGIGIKYDIEPEVLTEIVGDANRLKQVLVNLVGNAIKFTEEGEVTVSTKVDRIANESQSLRFEIHDTGIGIAPEKLDRIFESFVQGDGSTTRQFGGTGLGLAISKQLVELMGGKIGVESEPSKGTVFWFVIEFMVNSADCKKAGIQGGQYGIAS